jgi:RND family efflux transporter MFP subunit
MIRYSRSLGNCGSRSLPVTARLVPLSLALLLAACGRGDGAAQEESNEAVVAVSTAVVEARPFTETLNVIGAVTPRPDHFALLSAPGPTRVTKVLATVGQHVSRNQPLVQLDQTVFRATAQGAETRYATAERAYERAKRLVSEGISPRKELEQAESELATARADVAAARRASELAVLRSPISGVITRMDAVLGASVDISQPLVEIADPTNLDVVLNATPADAARIRIGASVSLIAGRDAAGEQLATGQVADISGAVDTTTRSFAVRVRVPAARRPMRIGETVYAQIALAVQPHAIVVPNEALVPEGEKFKVFVVDSSGLARSREVEVGARADSVSVILSGLAAGERVVTKGAYGIEDSSRVVAPRTRSAAAAPAKP